MPLSKNKIDFISNNVEKYLNQDSKSYYFDLMLYHDNNKKVFSIEKGIKIIFHKNKNLFKGFYFTENALRMKPMEFMTEKETKIAYETEEILIDLLEYLKTLDCKVLFVVSPYIEKESEKEAFNYAQKIIKEYGFDFLDSNEYNKEMKINYDTDFYHHGHLNLLGAEKYTKFLSKYLKENYELPDRRNDEKYNSWDELLPNWDENVFKTKEAIQKIIEGEQYENRIYVKK